MDGLEALRAQINETDSEMLDLFCRRMAISGEIAAYKKAHGLNVLDTSREAEVIATGVAKLEDAALIPYYKEFLENVMSVSRAWQAKLLGQNTVAYQGAVGSYQQAVASAMYPHAEGLALPTFADVFDAVEAGDAAFGVVPFENSNTGDVSGILDLCYNHSLYITAMVDLPVHHSLLALPGAKLSDIATIYSHPQALAQCRRFIQSLGAKPVEYANTALAAKFVAENGDAACAAIGSLAAGEEAGLIPLAQDISTEADNTTRFLVLAKQPGAPGDRFSLLVTIENKVGALERVLQAISAEGLSMESIKSRPMPKRPWEYYFYIELVGAHEAAGQLLEHIGGVCVSARMLGSYTRKVLDEA